MKEKKSILLFGHNWIFLTVNTNNDMVQYLAPKAIVFFNNRRHWDSGEIYKHFIE